MMDDLQQAYNAYQTALVHLPNPKVGLSPLRLMSSLLTRAINRNPGSGMALASSTTDMVPWTMPKMRSRRL